MTRKKLSNILSPLGIFALVVFFSCNGNNNGDHEATRTDTINNWMTVNITFQPTASYQLRQDYVNEIKQFLADHVRAARDSAQHRNYSSTFQESSKDSLHVAIAVILHRTYMLKDSVSDPRPPCPPIPGPRSIAEAGFDINCLLE